MPTQTSARSTSSGRILLIEEYDALIVAIRALLRQFAPNHAVRVGQSLGEAEAAIAEETPALVIIDGDVIPDGLTNFIKQLRKSCPASGLIVISEVARIGITDLHQREHVRVLPKPYDVADFGAAVRELLPAMEPAPVVLPEKIEEAPAPPPEISLPPKTGKKIVVVDDTEMLLLFVEDALCFADPQLRITTAPNGVAGVKEIETIQPDLVLLDYSLPDINGDEVCRRLLANKQTARIPVVMMSGHVAQMKTTAETYDNVVASIAKPFMSDALVALVQKTFAENLRPKPKPVIEKPPIVAAKTPPPAKILRSPQVEPPPAVPKAAPPPKIAQPKPEPPHDVVRPTPPPISTVPLQPDVSLRSTTPPADVTALRISTPATGKAGNEVVLGLNLEVVAMRLTPSLRMGAIRARPSSLTVSLHASPATVPSEIAFELGRTEMDAAHRLTILRLVPTRQQFERIATRTAVEVGALNVVAQDSRGQVQLTPSPNSTMAMHLLAHLDLASVELSTNFELAALVLRNRSQTVRVTLGSEQTGVFCEIAGIRLDASGRISEMLLNPLK